MDAQVPAVVAVVVTTDPGPWLDEALLSLAEQDYGELSVLVLSTGADDPEVTERVARVLPDAFVRHLPDRPGYAAASNEALAMVEGAAFFLLLHDDVALDPDAVHKMVEESFRSNAGVVSPKFVHWDDPRVLLHVGMSCDKTGAVVDRITEGEVDHGQHDAVRDVFVAPGGCILVRADLFAELKGFDGGIVAMGEDLDLSWRSQVAGSRVVVAPDARVRHREVVAGGVEPLMVTGEPGHRVTMQSLQRRHELRAVLKCYTRMHLVRVLPQAALLALGEVVVALLARDRDRVRAVTGAWRWNFRRLTELSLLRGELAAHRLFPDSEVRRLQVRGSARLSSYFSRLSHQGLEAANAVVVTRERAEQQDEQAGRVAVLTGSVGLAFSEDSDFDELDDLGRRAGRDRFGRRVRSSPLSTGRQRTVALVVALLVIAIGTRDLFFGTLPFVGQLAPLPSWSSSWHHFFSGWQSAGVGTTAPASSAFGLVGLSGTVLFGAMGTLQHVLLIGCIPLGAWGVSRCLRPLVSPRARVIAVICYLGLPLPYGALGTGRWDGLVAYALFPFIALLMARSAGVAPYAVPAGPHWRSRPAGQVALLGALIAVAATFAPAVVPMVLVMAVAWMLGSLLVGAREPTWRIFVVAVQAVVVALALTLPWVVGTALAGKGSVAIFGLPVTGATAPSWGEVLRFAVGPAARSPIAWLLVIGAALPLIIARGTRLAWAARMWVLALAAWGLAYATTRGDLGSFTPSETVVLAPAALAIAVCVGLGIAAFETDLSRREFGWRQLVSASALVFVALGLLPVLGGALGGRWDLPSQGVEQPLAFLARPGATGVARVLWLGDPRALPAGGWSVQPGLAYALTPEDLPTTAQVFAPAGPGPAEDVAKAVRLAVAGGTVHLGRLLAPAGVRYVVVVDALAPSLVGTGPQSVSAPPPAGLNTDLLEQNDLQAVPGLMGVQVYDNAADLPVTATRATALPVRAMTYPGAADVAGWQPVLSALADGGAATGAVPPGTLYAGYAPAGAFSLTVNGHAVARQPAFGWAAQYAVSDKGNATLSLARFPFIPLAVLVELAAWLVLAVALLGRPRRARGAPTAPLPLVAETAILSETVSL
ncbi:MAG TPA: glycosyltransferase [Acidimicrobiales bacterium]|jgi:GT2 family glycosyltransferase|nr:glycosyltransferase [Acidimicrobiales bacterium]